MHTMRNWFLIAGVALGVLGLGPQAGIAGVLSTSPLWADSNQSYHACNVTNVSTKPIHSLTVELVSGSGTVLITETITDLAPGGMHETSNFSGGGFAWCRFIGTTAGKIRANISVFHHTGTFFDTISFDMAR